jgi:hypothetical protein
MINSFGTKGTENYEYGFEIWRLRFWALRLGISVFHSYIKVHESYFYAGVVFAFGVGFQFRTLQLYSPF